VDPEWILRPIGSEGRRGDDRRHGSGGADERRAAGRHGDVGDLVTRITETDDSVQIVDSLTGASRLVDVSRRTGADVVLLTVDGDELPLYCHALLMERPRTRILGIAEHGRTGYLWELLPHRMPLGELSPRTLLSAMRGDVDAAPQPS
jgi:hypothetical protein